MYEKLKDYVIEFGKTDSMWADIGTRYVAELFEHFNDNDWREFYQDLPNKSSEWKISVIGCMVGDERKVLKAVTLMMSTENVYLLYLIVIILNNYKYNIIEDKYNLLTNDIKVLFIKYLKLLIPLVNDVYASTFSDFIHKNPIQEITGPERNR